MAGVLRGSVQSFSAVINFLFARGTGDFVVLYACETPLRGSGQIGQDVIEIQIVSDVAVKIAVTLITWITFIPTPDLFGGIKITTKSCDAIRSEDRREGTVARLRMGIKDAVGFRDEPANVRLLEDGLDIGDVSTFGQPNAFRVATKTGTIMIPCDENLRADRLWMAFQQREQSVGGGRRDNLDLARILKFFERRD